MSLKTRFYIQIYIYNYNIIIKNINIIQDGCHKDVLTKVKTSFCDSKVRNYFKITETFL